MFRTRSWLHIWHLYGDCFWFIMLRAHFLTETTIGIHVRCSTKTWRLWRLHKIEYPVSSKPFFAFNSCCAGIMKPGGSEESTIWKKPSRLMFRLQHFVVIWYCFGLAPLKWNMTQDSLKGKLTNLTWPFFEVVMLDEHNKREILLEFRGGFGLIFYLELDGVGTPLSKNSLVTHNALQS